MFDFTSRGGGRGGLAILTAAGLLAGGVAAAAPAGAADSTQKTRATQGQTFKSGAKVRGDKLGKQDRERIERARRTSDPRMTIMVVAKDGKIDEVARSIRAQGGYVRYTSTRLDYLSAEVRTANVTKTAGLSDVVAVDTDETFVQPKPESGTSSMPYIGPDSSTPDDNPYMPTRETGSTSFKRSNPAWDGRGVTVGVLDSGVDFDHPALRTTSTGEEKISDWFTATDPVTEGDFVAGGDPSWLPMIQDATGPTFPTTGTYRGSVWTLPAGSYKIRTLDEAKTNLVGCELCGDVNRDGDKTDRIGVLYDPATHAVRVDTDDDKDFTDETAMTRYKASGQVGHIGSDNPRTQVREAVPFVVDYREHLDYTILGLPASYNDVTAVDIGLSSGAHGSHVAGIVAANDMFGGKMDGQAPGAKIVSARACTYGAGCTAAALTDGMAELATNRGVDIINMSIGGLPALNDGDNARAELYNKIINDVGVQLVISAGNSGAALNTIGDPSVATDVVSVGADISKETWKANYGSTVDFAKNIMTFSSGGPREDGGFKPSITAPGSAISTTNLWLPGSAVAETNYGLPSGYSMFNGTSMAAPQAAGAMTLLLSAAKAQNLTSTSPAALRQAVYGSARWNSAIPAFLQGHGQIFVPAAWDVLRRNVAPVKIATSAPVCTEIWKLLGRTDGVGLYNRCDAASGGQAPGSTRSYAVTLTRTTGPDAPTAYTLRLRGNDGTYKLSQSAVTLKKNVPTTIRVVATPTAGAHSAVLAIDDPRSPGLEASMMAVVVAAQNVAADNTLSWSGVSKRNVTQRFYVNVPAGAKALELSMSGLAPGSQTRFIAFHPYGLPQGSTSSIACYSNYGTPPGNGCNPAVRAFANPTPGVWEVLVESRRTSPLLENPFTLGAKLLGATVTPATTTLESVDKGVATPLSWTVTNQYAGVTAKAVGGPLGSARSERPTIADHAVQTYTVVVPAGASKLDVSIGRTSDTGADLDLYVTGPSGSKQAADGDSEEAVSYANPLPGTYTVTVDGYSVPAGSTQYDYLDVFFSSALGAVDVDSTPFEFPAGATRTVSGTVTANQGVDAGRSLFGSMSVVSDSGALLGKADVLIKAVIG